MSAHFRNECEHGRVYGQCRCPSPSKTVNRVDCPDDRWHRENVSDYKPRHAL